MRLLIVGHNTEIPLREILRTCTLIGDREVPQLDASVFIIPDTVVKNGQERLLVLKRTVMSIVEYVRGTHRQSVFPYKGKRLLKMNNTAWRNAQAKVGLPQVRAGWQLVRERLMSGPISRPV